MKRALIVDDDKILLAVLEKVLRNVGLQVQIASDAHQALRLLKQFNFNLILTDANMPSLSGFELLEIVKRNEVAYGFPKIVMLTGRTTKRDEELALLGGAHRFITKPTTPDAIKAIVIEMLDLKKSESHEPGLQVSDIARWTGAFEITRIFEDRLEFRSQVALTAGTQIVIGSALLNAVSPAFANVEVSRCAPDESAHGFTITARFFSIVEQDVERMRDWISRERKSA